MSLSKIERLAALLVAVLTVACSQGEATDAAAPAPPAGLFGTLPIYWGEDQELTDLLDADAEPGWVRKLLEEQVVLRPMDALEEEALEGVDRLILAQPRPLAPSENVAFDRWVREGGRVLIFADPMLTSHSRFGLGDRRRPQDVVLISPILAHWGLELRFDENQPDGERIERSGNQAYPVELAGQFVPADQGEDASCDISPGGLVARCRIGEGHATLFADAALLEWHASGEPPQERREALEKLVTTSLDP